MTITVTIAAFAATSLNIEAMFAKHCANVVNRTTATTLCTPLSIPSGDIRRMYPDAALLRSKELERAQGIHHVRGQAEPPCHDRRDRVLEQAEDSERVDGEHGERRDHENGDRLPQEPQEPMSRFADHGGHPGHADGRKLLDKLAVVLLREELVEDEPGRDLRER